MTSQKTQSISAPIRFVDFVIRAWREGKYLQVIAHTTPAGGMRQPVAVKVGNFTSDDFHVPVDAKLAVAAAVGHELARFILPQDIWDLLRESMIIVAPKDDLGLRVRLCLDEELVDLPWEFLVRPDTEFPVSLSGFLLTDDRISLVREPQSVTTSMWPTDHAQRGLFVGTYFDDNSDMWGVKAEYDSLVTALHAHKRLITMEFSRTDDTNEVTRQLKAGLDFFHYAGHVELCNGRGAMVNLANAASFNKQPAQIKSLQTGKHTDWSWSDDLAPKLAHSGVRLAVFNACNSGNWSFVQPFMRAGIPAVIGVQGLVSNLASLNFAEKLYQSLAVGLSLDEALNYARLYITDPRRAAHECDWGRFMAYMPTDLPVLFPRTEHKKITQAQNDVRFARDRTVQNTRLRLREDSGADVSRMLSEIASRSVLILGRFTDERKKILNAIRKVLSTPPRQYVPILFDFEKPDDRDLIESVLRFAAVSRFVIADISDPKSVPAELQAIVPQFPSLPVSLIIESSQREYPVSDNLLRRDSVIKPIVKYLDEEHLLSSLDSKVIAPAETLYISLTERVG